MLHGDFFPVVDQDKGCMTIYWQLVGFWELVKLIAMFPMFS